MEHRSPLNTAQLNRIEHFEHLSFLEYCAKIDVDPVAHEADLLKGLQEDARLRDESLSRLSDDYSREHPDGFGRFLSATNFKAVRRLVTEDRRQGVAEDVEQSLRELPIDHDYVDRLASRLGFETSKWTTEDRLSRVIRAVPCLSLWSTDFDAFLEHKYEIDLIPCICVSELLSSVVATFADFITPMLLDLSFGIPAPASPSLCERRGALPDFKHYCEKVFRVLLGEAYAIRLEQDVQLPFLRRQGAEWNFVHALIETSAQDLVWFHEFGHLLCGHQDVSARIPSLEFEADAFAFIVQRRKYARDDWNSWACLGAVITMFLAAVVEAKKGAVEANTHPPIRDRMKRFLAKFKAELKSDLAAENVRNIEILCRETLQGTWGITVSI